jgi:small subunit ribosomal protein S5
MSEEIINEEGAETTQEIVEEAVAEANALPEVESVTPRPQAARPVAARPIASRGAHSPRLGANAGVGAGASQARSNFKRPFKPAEKGPDGKPIRRPGGDRNNRRGSFETTKPEFEQKILSIRRVVRVVSGGRRLSFAVSMIIGDKKGSIGVGTGKSIDTSLAIGKALKNAKKNLVRLKLTKELSLPYDVQAKYATSKITLMPNRGKGLVAGSAARDILKLGGLKNVTAKFHSGSKNKLNNARATIVALSEFAIKRMPKITFDEPIKANEKVTEIGPLSNTLSSNETTS